MRVISSHVENLLEIINILSEETDLKCLFGDNKSLLSRLLKTRPGFLSNFTDIGKFLIEFLKGEVLMFWIIEASDDMAGKLLRYEFFESQRGHPRFEDFSVLLVP